MGNWRTVQIIGSCDNSEVSKLSECIKLDRNYDNKLIGFTCISTGAGLCGLPNWAKVNINVVGNLAERGYDEDSIKESLEQIINHVPSLKVKIHLGGNYESKKCVKTISAENGIVTIKKPEIKKIGELDQEEMTKNLINQLTRNQRD